MKLNTMTAKWIGIRAEIRGRGAKLLKHAGFLKQPHASANNRNACDFIMPSGARGLSDFHELFGKLGRVGFRGIAVEWRDIQWKHNAGLTNHQWRNRVQIG